MKKKILITEAQLLKLVENYGGNIITLRSKSDEMFRYDITYNDDKITRTEIQGDIKDNLDNKYWLDLIINLGVGKILNYDVLRNVLNNIPDLYVKDFI